MELFRFKEPADAAAEWQYMRLVNCRHQRSGLYLCGSKLVQRLNFEVIAVQVYGGQNNAGQFDAVLTCFFLDTAHNVLVSTVCCRWLHLSKSL